MPDESRRPHMTAKLRRHFDLYPFARSGTVTICAVSAMHLVQATLILASGPAVKATATEAVLKVFRVVGAPDGADFMAALLLASALSALAGTFLRLGWPRLAILLPQHLTLGIMAFGGVVAAAHGTYLDGTAIPWSHIVTDQIGYAALFVAHTSAILRRARDDG